ncbi:MAG: NAD-dependent deacylase [Rubricella sp.]
MGNAIVILTGAGISAESGLGTFRDKDGLWTRYDLREVATPEGFARDPGLVFDFYNARRINCAEAEPNAAHAALARLQKERAGISIVTQNVDDLHERAGADVIHMHGELMKALCRACGARSAWRDTLDARSVCPRCSHAALRPDVVWFGEVPYQMERIHDLLLEADLFVAIGTSGEVYPAAGFVEMARAAGIETLELNLEPSAATPLFAEARHGPASVVVPAWVEELLRSE